MLLRIMALVTAVVHMVSTQDRGTNLLQDEQAGNSQSVIITAKTKSFLSCESGDIVVKVNFTDPFRGIMYAHRSRNSPCRMHGTGGYYYELRIPLKGCGTWQESPRVFMNNVTIRFHPALELEEDETKTVVCRYPPPLTPSPGSIQVVSPVTLIPSTVPTRVGAAALSEVEILIIICLLLFLSLLILGIGIAYFCLKRRNIRIVRKASAHPSSSSAPASQLTRLSSSHPPAPPSLLLSSVLGHTVRIPRAVPYSAPRVAGRASAMSEHAYEDYPAGGSTTTETSETSASPSSVEDNADVSKRLLYRKGGAKSLFSIPKAILRRTGGRRWRTEVADTHRYSKASRSAETSAKRLEMEDQTVTTVLEPEMNGEDRAYWLQRNGFRSTGKSLEDVTRRNAEALSGRDSMPVYAQVDKRKRTRKPTETESSTYEQGEPSPPKTRPPKWPSRLMTLPGAPKRKHEVIAEVPEESRTSEEVTKCTTVTTSVRREVTETTVSSKKDIRSEDPKRVSQEKKPREGTSDGPGEAKPPQPGKNLLIRDVADVYLTTTVETESRELKTTVSRDVIEKHAKIGAVSPNASQPKVEEASAKSSAVTDNWNVVIRQRPPPSRGEEQKGTDLDASSEDGTESGIVDDSKPQFDVTIRAIPPSELKPKKFEGMMNVPLLEMPQTVGALKSALSSKSSDEEKPKEGQTARTVRWTEDTKDNKPDDNSTISSSDSFHSSDSLRERSSSEVLEVAPTLPSQHSSSDHPMLERSTSEIVTSPEDHVRWIGGVVPVLENLSPEFLANIPVVAQGGFFNSQKSPTPDSKPESS